MAKLIFPPPDALNSQFSTQVKTHGESWVPPRHHTERAGRLLKRDCFLVRTATHHSGTVLQ